jgi:hypothetical protein
MSSLQEKHLELSKQYNILTDERSRILDEINSILQVWKKAQKARKSVGAYRVEYAVKAVEEEEIVKRCQSIKSQMNRLFYESGQLRSLTKAKASTLEKEVCGICHDVHGIKDVMTLDACGHLFGARCFGEWTKQCFHKGKEVSCPMCRGENRGITRYRRK